MRTQLLCALALLCGAGVVHAQQGWTANGAGGDPQGYGTNAYAAGQPGDPNVAGLAYPDYSNSAAGFGYAPNNMGYAGNGEPGPGAYPAPAVQAWGGGYPPHAGQPALNPPMMPPPSFVDEVKPEPLPCNYKWWGSADYMMSWIRPERLTTPLLTVGAATDTPPGALGQPGTGVVFGDRINYNMFNGVRAEAGLFCDKGCRLLVEGGVQFFGTSSEHFALASDAAGKPIITRPFFNAMTGTNGAIGTSDPITGSGATTIDARAEMFGTELNTGYLLCCCPDFRLYGLVGIRYLYLGESLTIRDDRTPLANLAPPPDTLLFFQGATIPLASTLTSLDQFRTRNNFYGGQVGAKFRWDCPWLVVDGYGKIGVGVTDQVVDIRGSSVLVTPTSTTMAPGGVLALPSNIGHHNQTVFSVTPEAGLNVGLKLTSHIQLRAGYSFLLWSEVARPGRQIDPQINPSLVPTRPEFAGMSSGPIRPLFNFNNEVVWMHNLTLGIAFQY